MVSQSLMLVDFGFYRRFSGSNRFQYMAGMMENLSNAAVMSGFSVGLGVFAVTYLIDRAYLFLKGLLS